MSRLAPDLEILAKGPAACLSAHAIRAALSKLWLWYRRHRTRRHLQRLEGFRLSDVGLSSGDREQECRKWFWRR